MSINQVIVSGRLTRDAEIKQTPAGLVIASFGIAVNERYKSGEEWKERANFFDCSMFGKRAQSLAQYLTKGKQVVVSGKLHYSEWSKDGQKKSRVDITVADIDLFSGKSGTNSTQAQNMSNNAPQESVQASMQVNMADEDIPF